MILFLWPMRLAAQPSPADLWLTNAAQFPPFIATETVRQETFASLHAQVVAGRLKVIWTGQGSEGLSARIFASADAPGHWPARDWRAQAMDFRGGTWEASVMVEHLDLPVIYFAQVTGPAFTNVSPMRVCHPREAGLELPTRLFWPFLEGFEEGLESWRWLGGTNDQAMRIDGTAKTGRAALSVTIPAGQRSASVGTTRLRGWRIVEAGAGAVELWARTRRGSGQARFTIHANAFSTNQVVATHPAASELTEQWRKVELPFASFGKVPLTEVDFFTVEFIGQGGMEFLMDELRLTRGRQ